MREFLGEMGGIFTEDYLVRSKLRAGADSVSLATLTLRLSSPVPRRRRASDHMLRYEILTEI